VYYGPSNDISAIWFDPISGSQKAFKQNASSNAFGGQPDVTQIGRFNSRPWFSRELSFPFNDQYLLNGA
jgi:hypothetical protein